jgi:hypothetical protein
MNPLKQSSLLLTQAQQGPDTEIEVLLLHKRREEAYCWQSAGTVTAGPMAIFWFSVYTFIFPPSSLVLLNDKRRVRLFFFNW